MKYTGSSEIRLDNIDKRIIQHLTSSRKSPLAVIAKEIGISTTAVHQRVKKLEQAKIIENDVSIINPRVLGYKVVSYIGVYLEKPSHYKEAIEALKKVDEVLEAHYTTGNYTIFLKVICRDNDHLMEILSKLQTLKGVTRTETIISLEQSINRQLNI